MEGFRGKHAVIMGGFLTLLPMSLVPLLLVSCRGSDTGSLTGTCTGTWDRPIAGVEVILTRRNPEELKTSIADEDGVYEIEDLQPGNDYTITYKKEGFDEIRKSGVIIEAGRRTVLDISIGRWEKMRSDAPELTEEQRRRIEELESIGYLAGYQEATEKKNVTIHDEGLAFRGLNLYTSGHKATAYLIDMEGRSLHEWFYDRYLEWASEGGESYYWRRVFLYPNGDLLAIYEGAGIIKLDKDSNLLWANPNGAHHDLDVTPDGLIYVLTREAKMNLRIHLLEPVLEDFISILTPEGESIKKVSLYEAYRNSSYGDVLEGMAPHGDIFHTNTLEIFDGRHSGKSPIFEKGNALISSREMDNIAIVDLEEEKVVWSMSGDWRRQHQPTLLSNGNILLFDNMHDRESSKIIEFDPMRGTVHWMYPNEPSPSFFSSSCGSNQRLANGNTLITESDNGRAFEVTRDGKIVWEFYNPNRAGNDDELVATLFELIRLEPGYLGEMGDRNSKRPAAPAPARGGRSSPRRPSPRDRAPSTETARRPPNRAAREDTACARWSSSSTGSPTRRGISSSRPTS